MNNLTARAFTEMMKDVGTSIPGHILAFDPITQLAQVQIGIVKTRIDGMTFEPTPLIEVPVYFFGGAYCIEVQIDPLTEGVIVFSQRCIDAWVNTGGVAENPIMRFHDFSDACFLPGLRSQPNKIADFKNNGIRMRNADGTNYIWLKNDGTAEIKAALTVTGNITQTGDITSSGTITATTDVKGGGVSLLSHTHEYVNTLPNGTPAPITTTTPPTPEAP